ncbi:purple acid phosphatase family protein [Nocardiopsis nanhaiensis]
MSVTARSTAHRSLTFLALGALAAAPALTLPSPALAESGPERILLSPTDDPAASQHVTWRSADADEDAQLEISPAGGTDEVEQIPAESTGEAADHHYYRVTLTDLEADTEYGYRIVPGEGEPSPWQTFTTADTEAAPYDFLYFGDIQNDITEHATPVVQAALEAEPGAELAVHAGDLIDHANDDSEWGEWYDAFGPEATGGINHVAAAGNHEYADNALSGHWPLQFPSAGNGPEEGTDLNETVYSTDYQGVRYISLSSNYRDADIDDIDAWLELQQDWLAQTLEDNPHEWTVVTFHHPLFSNSPGRDNEPLRDAWLDTLEDYDVDLVLQGHDHSYSRGNLVENRTENPDAHTGPVYVVSVAGPKMYEATDENWTDNGAEARVQVTDTQTYQTVSVDGSTLEYEATTAAGETVDAFTITKDDGEKLVTEQNDQR